MKYLLFTILLIPSLVHAQVSFGTGLIGYWPMDTRDTIYSTSASSTQDRSTTNATAYMYGFNPGTQALQGGKVGQAFNFNATTQMLRATTSTPGDNTFQFGASQNWTITLWASTTKNNASGDDIITSRYVQGGSRQPWYIVQNTTNKLSMSIYDGTFNPRINGTTLINNGKWHFLVAQRDKTNGVLRLFVDGVSDATAVTDTTTGSFVTPNWVNIGCLPTISEAACSANSSFTGEIDDLRIYNRVLTTAEINGLYRQGLSSHQGSWVSSILSAIGL